MRAFLIFVSASVILVPTAFPQAPDWTLRPQAPSTQAQDAANLALADALKQFPGNGFSQNPAQPAQRPRPHPLLSPQVSPLQVSPLQVSPLQMSPLQMSPLQMSPLQMSPWTGPFAKIGPYGNGLDLRIRQQELLGVLPNPSKVCSVPLLEVPVDGSLDKGLRIPDGMRSGSSADPKMAQPPPAPACDNRSLPDPKLKAK